MLTYLFIWQIVAVGHNSAGYIGSHERKSWQNVGEFASPDACNAAGRNLGISKGQYRCIVAKTGEMK